MRADISVHGKRLRGSVSMRPRQRRAELRVWRRCDWVRAVNLDFTGRCASHATRTTFPRTLRAPAPGRGRSRVERHPEPVLAGEASESKGRTSPSPQPRRTLCASGPQGPLPALRVRARVDLGAAAGVAGRGPVPEWIVQPQEPHAPRRTPSPLGWGGCAAGRDPFPPRERPEGGERRAGPSGSGREGAGAGAEGSRGWPRWREERCERPRRLKARRPGPVPPRSPGLVHRRRGGLSVAPALADGPRRARGRYQPAPQGDTRRVGRHARRAGPLPPPAAPGPCRFYERHTRPRDPRPGGRLPSPGRPPWRPLPPSPTRGPSTGPED